MWVHNFVEVSSICQTAYIIHWIKPFFHPTSPLSGEKKKKKKKKKTNQNPYENKTKLIWTLDLAYTQLSS
jgi:hypothetical protein